MALSASTVIEINSAATASNVNGGGFNPANANMMTDLAATDANTSAPVCTSASYTFVAGDVGHWLYIKAGTNWAVGWYKIASVTAGAATLSAAVGSVSVIQVVNNRYGVNTVIGCATVASPTGGTFTIDYSQSTASPFASTDIALVTNTTITSGANPFTSAMVGNLIHFTAGTGFTVGWYEIVSVTAVTATIDRAAGTAPLTNGTGKVGGALSLGSSDDDAVFELAVSSTTASTRYFIKGNATYTLGGTVMVAADGNNSWHVIREGYATSRGDRPTGSTRPIINCGAELFTDDGSRTDSYSIAWTGTGNTVNMFDAGIGNYYENCKFTNLGTTANQSAVSTLGVGSFFYRCEFVSIRGDAVKVSNVGSAAFIECYFHDSNRLFVSLAGTDIVFTNNLLVNAVTTAVTAGQAGERFNIRNCTFYGAENKLGTGVLGITATTRILSQNNIFYGFTTGCSFPNITASIIDDYNCFYNNTNDVNDTTKWFTGANNIATDPTFAGVTQRTGSTATTTAGNHLVQTGATFVTWGIAVGDFIHVKSGTGPTAGIYTILSVDSETQITTDQTLTANATADKVWQITTGRNFAVGTNMKGFGSPGTFPGATATVAYTDIGAVQRQEAGAATAGGGIFNSSIIRAA